MSWIEETLVAFDVDVCDWQGRKLCRSAITRPLALYNFAYSSACRVQYYIIHAKKLGCRCHIKIFSGFLTYSCKIKVPRAYLMGALKV